MAFAYVDQRWSKQERARLPMLDRAFLYGDAVFATVRIQDGVALFWPKHRRALLARARRIGLKPMPSAQIDNVMLSLPRKAGVWALRITVSREPGRGLRSSNAAAVSALYEQVPSGKLNEAELGFAVADRMATPYTLHDVKRPAYGETIAALAQMPQRVTDVLWMSSEQNVYESGTGNIFIITQDGLWTPKADGTILPGVTREVVLGMRQFGAKEELIDGGSLTYAHGAFTTSAVRGLVPVAAFWSAARRYPIPWTPRARSLTLAIAAAYDRLIMRQVDRQR